MRLKPGVVVPISIEDSSDPLFGQIGEIFVKDSVVLVGPKVFQVLECAEHYHSWMVEHSQKLCVVLTKDLPSRQVLTLRPVRGT